jgi:hypothetical protein
MLYSEIIAVYSKIYTKHINTPCGQNVEFFSEPGGTFNNHWAVKELTFESPVVASRGLIK